MKAHPSAPRSICASPRTGRPSTICPSRTSADRQSAIARPTIAALIGHAKSSVTSKYVHTLDSTLIMAADTVSGYVKALLEGVEFRRNTYTLDRQTRRSAINEMLAQAKPMTVPQTA